tara:strand:+ start:230 stop:1258 length:1029 start_codon:yes stop_codon:yes gene_type:complete
MSPKNLNALDKTHKILLNKLKDKQILKIYKKFEKNLKLDEDFIVAVSGGPDSLALSFLSKIYAIRKSLKVRYFIVDHKLRKNSSIEAKFTKNLMKKISVKLDILSWIGKKPKSNIQSIARLKRYALLFNKAKKFKIKNILLGHHKDDLYENFFIRILRGSGLNGLVSFDEISRSQNINLVRPLLIFKKHDLINISKKVFDSYVNDPSNENEKFRRIKIRNFIQNLKSEGLDLAKFDLTIKNLKFSNNSIKFFTQKNLKENSTSFDKNKSIVISKEFFDNPEEVVFRSFSEVIKNVGKKYYPARGKKIVNILGLIKNKSLFKTTLGNCLIRKVNQTVIVTKEH